MQHKKRPLQLFKPIGDFNFLEKTLLKRHLSKIMGEKRLKMSDVSRDTGINPGTSRCMFNETAARVELNVVETLCEYLKIEVGDLYELPKKNTEEKIED